MIERYGAPAIYGRPLSYQEVNTISTCLAVYEAYRARAASGNWAEWAQSNKGLSDLLNSAMLAAHRL